MASEVVAFAALLVVMGFTAVLAGGLADKERLFVAGILLCAVGTGIVIMLWCSDLSVSIGG